MRFAISIALIAIGLLPIAAGAQNIEFVGSYSIPSETRGVFAVSNYAYLIDWHNLYIIDVTNPSAPTLAGSYIFQNVNASAIFVSGNYAYITSGYYSTLGIYDVSNPASPAFVSSIHTTDAAKNVYVNGNYAYVVGSFCDVEQSVGQLATIDISDPANPTQVDLRGYPNCIKGVFVAGINVYMAQFNVFSNNEGYLKIVNSEPDNEFDVGELDSFQDAVGVSVENNYAYLVDGDLEIINVADPADPILTSSLITPGDALNVTAAGNYAFVADGLSGIVAVDVSNPDNPVIASSYNTPGNAKSVFVFNNYIYVADSSSLQILHFTPTGIEDSGKLPGDFSLSQNHPNPFNPTTVISYGIPRAMPVALKIYNIIGQQVARLDEGMQQAGEHSIKWDAEGFPSGIYFARLESGQHSQIIKMVLLK